MNTKDHANVAFHPPLLLLAALIAGTVLRFIVPAPFLSDAVGDPVGAILFIVSWGIFIWAVVIMRKGGASVPTSLPTDAIVRRGPYRWSRNPIYLAMVLLVTSIGIGLNSLWYLALAAAMVVLLQVGVIVREEAYLAGKFGAAYLDYKASVRRWI
jgi:protein-S-isoprenylcysteine O-methyltransferase Ste14